jgi:hypothetical protein
MTGPESGAAALLGCPVQGGGGAWLPRRRKGGRDGCRHGWPGGGTSCVGGS